MENKSKYIKFGAVFLIAVFILLVSIFYKNGYRIQPNLKIAKNGNIILNIPLKGTTIYKDSKKFITTDIENQEIKIPSSFKTHNIITERAGYFPWQKNVEVGESRDYKINPVFVTVNTTGFIINQNDTEYWNIRYKIINQNLPTKENPLKLSNGDMLFVDEENNIMLSNGTTTFSVIKPLTKVRSVSFYKKSSENIIFASDVGVYLIDTSRETPKNFFPIYKGKEPIFITENDNLIYVFDNQNLLSVVI